MLRSPLSGSFHCGDRAALHAKVMVIKRFPSLSLLLACTLGALCSPPARAAAPSDAMHDCLAKKLESAPAEATVGELREACTQELKTSAAPVIPPEPSLAYKRMQDEIHTEQNPFLLTAYKQNYVLPWSYVTHQNPLYSDHG